MNWQDYNPSQLSGKNRRLLHEWKELDSAIMKRNDTEYRITRQNGQGLPAEYIITYNIRSICGVENIDRLNAPGITNAPVFANRFTMRIHIPENYPCIDAPAEYTFLTRTPEGEEIPHPWHPNIRYFGEFAGRVCLNTPDTYAGIIWSVSRVARYLRYDLYHAIQEPPYPEDFKVAEWVIRQAEPNGWLNFAPQSI